MRNLAQRNQNYKIHQQLLEIHNVKLESDTPVVCLGGLKHGWNVEESWD